MNKQFISSVHIEKLGHKIEEIRVRALNNILSKLQQNFVYDNELARSLELLKKLIDWFSFETFSDEENVLTLIKNVLTSESGPLILRHLGSEKLRHDFKDIRSKIKSCHYNLIDDILQLCDKPTAVPPLESDVPLSYRSGQTDTPRFTDADPTKTRSSSVSTTYRSPPTFRNDQIQNDGPPLSAKHSEFRSPKSYMFEVNESLPFVTFKLQNLAASDLHVLKSLEESLQNAEQPSTLLQSCEFFCNVILQDFPAEVFFQRTKIISLFHDFIKSCPSTTITNSSLLCLNRFTEKLIVRLNSLKDPGICTFKNIDGGASEKYNLPSCLNVRDEVDDLETSEDALLAFKQTSLQQYCIYTMYTILCYISEKMALFRNDDRRRKIKYGMNLAVDLFDNVNVLMTFCIKPSIWNNQNGSGNAEIVKKLTTLLDKFGDLLTELSLKMCANDMENFERIIQLHLLHSICILLKNLVPITSVDKSLPRSLKNALASSLLDASFSRLYPSGHEAILQYVNEFEGCYEFHSLKKYKDVQQICMSMSSAVKFIKHGLTDDIKYSLRYVNDSLPSLEFHKNLDVIDNFLKICIDYHLVYSKSENLQKKVDGTLLALLSHGDEDIRNKTYTDIQKLILKSIGAKYSKQKIAEDPGAELLFFFRPNIFIEVICHGLMCDNIQITTISEDILIYILKCKILVSETIWRTLIASLIPAFPLLHCYADLDTPLGKTIIRMIDPDVSSSLLIPLIEVIKGNLRLLFNGNVNVRNEAVSRLCWILTMEKDAELKMPKITYLKDCGLSNIFQHNFNHNLTKNTERQFYQASSLCQVMELLASDKVEPSIRRSALTQVSVMLEDHFLHSTFLENKGLTLILDIFNNAFYTREYKNYLDSIISVVIILKNICLHNASVRQELSSNEDFYFSLLRAFFLYSTDKVVQHDGALLLALLVYSEYALYNSSNGVLSLPEVVIQKNRIPFKCNSHWKISPHVMPSLRVTYKSDTWSQSAIRMHWNIEWYRRIDELMKIFEHSLEDSKTLPFSPDLRLNSNDLQALKATSAVHCCQNYLNDIENASTHNEVFEAVQGLRGYINMWTLLSKYKMHMMEDSLLSLGWKSNFLRFLCAPPASTEDQKLLSEILDFLTQMVVLYRYFDKYSWVMDIIKDSTHYFYKMLQSESETETKAVSLNILQLIAECAINERSDVEKRFIYKRQPSENDRTKSWMHIVQIISENLKYRETDQFYNLAYIDKLLSCLVDITSNSGWSKYCTSSINLHKIYIELIDSLSELLLAFHYGKGPQACMSFMGFNVTRNTLLIMNHILSEMQNVYKKPWEPYWIRDTVCSSTILNLESLWYSRDVIIRASMLHLLVGMAASGRGTTKLVEYIHQTNGGLWECALSILLNHTEASIVREKAALLLVNISSHVNTTRKGQISLPLCHAPMVQNNDLTGIDIVYNALDEFNFFEELNKIIAMYTTDTVECDCVIQKCYTTGSASSKPSVLVDGHLEERNINISSKLVTNSAYFFINLMHISPAKTTEKMIDNGVIRSFFRCLASPALAITSYKEVIIYRNVLEMYGAVCALLKNCVLYNSASLNIILHTRDSLFMLISLLKTDFYDGRSEYFINLRNQFWRKIYLLLSTIINVNMDKYGNGKSCSECYNIFVSLIIQSGYEPFMKVVFESLTSLDLDLQKSALQFLTSLLSLELCSDDDDVEKTSFFRSLLDKTKSPSEKTAKRVSYESEELSTGKSKHLEGSTQSLSNTYWNNVVSNVPLKTRSSDRPNTCHTDYYGGELSKILIKIYYLNNVESEKDCKYNIVVIKALAALLNISNEAKKSALDNNLMETLVTHIRQLHLEISLHSAEALRRIQEKRKVSPILKETTCLFGLMVNFISGDINVKICAAKLGLADLGHKFWVWGTLDRNMLVNILKMLCTLTFSCEEGCSSLILTSTSPGTGPRKMATNTTILHAVFTLIGKEMDLISRSHNIGVLNLCFELLENVCSVTECRVIISKSNLLQAVNRLHPSFTKFQNNWEIVESLWMHFILTFTYYPEGQVAVVKSNDLFDLLIVLVNQSKSTNKILALSILRNIAFHQPNKIKLLTSVEFIQILHTKLQIGNNEEKNIVISIIWTLVANSQRSKIAVKCAGLDTRLGDLIKQWQLNEAHTKNFKIASYVFSLLRDKDK